MNLVNRTNYDRKHTPRTNPNMNPPAHIKSLETPYNIPQEHYHRITPKTTNTHSKKQKPPKINNKNTQKKTNHPKLTIKKHLKIPKPPKITIKKHYKTTSPGSPTPPPTSRVSSPAAAKPSMAPRAVEAAKSTRSPSGSYSSRVGECFLKMGLR